jgi:hypothetical protein
MFFPDIARNDFKHCLKKFSQPINGGMISTIDLATNYYF